MQEELVTVVIPVYNVSKYLEKSLESVVSQTYSALQIIIVNDGSTDNSLDICNNYAKKDSRIEIVNKENGGLSSARNAALDLVKGKYLYIMDSDDYISDKLIEIMLNSMLSFDADLVCCNKIKVYENDTKREYSSFESRVYDISDEKQKLNFLANQLLKYKIGYEVWNKLYKTDIVKENKLIFENNYEIYAEDLCFNSYYICHINKVAIIDDRLYYYLVRGNSITGKRSKDVFIVEYMNLLIHLYEHIRCIGCYSYIEENFYLLFLVLMKKEVDRMKIYEFHRYIPKISDINMWNRFCLDAMNKKENTIAYFGKKDTKFYTKMSFILYNVNLRGKISGMIFQINKVISRLL